MSYASHVFRHTPALAHRVIPLEESQMRFGQERFVEYEAQAKAENWPSGWRMEDGAREANRQKVLSGRMSDDLWVFAYGSLIWDPAVEVEEYRYATLGGWHRSFCMRLDSGRGSYAHPGLMAALDEGGQCDGVVLRIPGPLVNRETEFMWRREMFSGAYRPIFLDVTTPQGAVNALVFVMDRANARYMPDLTQDQAAHMIAKAEGSLGSNFAYLDSLIKNLDDLGINYDDMRALHRKARDARSQS